MTIQELKQQRRWVLWRLETVNGKQTKVPYQPNGRHAMANKAATWHTYAECAAVASQFSGVGLVLGNGVWGVDIDGCCDAVTGKFTPQSREIVIDLDSYAEYSPSGLGAHVLGCGNLYGPGLKNEHPGCKAVEVKAEGYYFTFTGRHLSKTPADLMDRQEQILALYDRVSKLAGPQKTGLAVIPVSEEERFRKLMAGDMSDYKDDHSTADFALCILLAKKHGCNAFKIDAAFRESGLYREKWDRDDYRENTITKACVAVAKDSPVIFADPEDVMDEDAPTTWIVQPLPGHEEGWFPCGEVSLIGGPSGAGKTHALLRMAEGARRQADVFGHTTTASEYCILLHDRSTASMRRTCKAAKLPLDEVMSRVIRLTKAQQKARPAEVVEAAIQTRPGVTLWVLEGLDFWTPKISDMEAVGDVMDELQRVAKQYRVAVVGTLGSPKQRVNDHYAAGRDQFMGSVAFGRKGETCISISRTTDKDVRQMSVMPRNTRDEEFFFTWTDAGLTLTTEPDKPAESESALTRMGVAVHLKFGTEQPFKYLPSLGAPTTFKRWRCWAEDNDLIHKYKGRWYLIPQETGVTVTSEN